LSRTQPHDEFLELCAILTSGELSAEEREKLQEHLAVCAACREALEQYQAITDGEIPSIAAAECGPVTDAGSTWSPKQAEKRFRESFSSHEASHTMGRVSVESAWQSMWLLYAAAGVLFVALGVLAYRVGMQKGTTHTAELTQLKAPHSDALDQTALEAQLSDASHDRELERAAIAQRDQTIAELREQLQRQASELALMRTTQEDLESKLKTGGQENQALIQQKSKLATDLQVAEARARDFESKLESLEKESAQAAAGATSAQAKVNELTRMLQQRELVLEQQDQLLAHDRDIRELMGARDLYIAEVYDVAGSGETSKPFGRVFYTRGKSLIFYAYDLDQQTGLKQVNTFQAWGRRGPDREHAVNLGIFYEDNASRKRWIMKCEDSKTLNQIDAVFVTVEPTGGSRKPSSRPLLFAYLKVDPNHP